MTESRVRTTIIQPRFWSREKSVCSRSTTSKTSQARERTDRSVEFGGDDKQQHHHEDVTGGPSQAEDSSGRRE